MVKCLNHLPSSTPAQQSYTWLLSRGFRILQIAHSWALATAPRYSHLCDSFWTTAITIPKPLKGSWKKRVKQVGGAMPCGKMCVYVCEHAELCYLKSQVSVCKQEQGVADSAGDTTMALGFGESGREDVHHDRIAACTATLDFRDAQKGEGREMSRNSKLLENYMVFKQPQPNTPKMGGEID